MLYQLSNTCTSNVHTVMTVVTLHVHACSFHTCPRPGLSCRVTCMWVNPRLTLVNRRRCACAWRDGIPTCAVGVGRCQSGSPKLWWGWGQWAGSRDPASGPVHWQTSMLRSLPTWWRWHSRLGVRVGTSRSINLYQRPLSIKRVLM